MLLVLLKDTVKTYTSKIFVFEENTSINNLSWDSNHCYNLVSEIIIEEIELKEQKLNKTNKNKTKKQKEEPEFFTKQLVSNLILYTKNFIE